MEITKFFGFLEILKDSFKIMQKNGKLMAMVASIYLVISSLFFLFNISTIKPLISDFVTKTLKLSSIDPHGLPFANALLAMTKDVKTLIGVELAFILASILMSLFAQTATILLASVSYNNKKLSLKHLLVRMPQPLKRLFITSFHTKLLNTGFLYFGFITIMAPTIMVFDYKSIIVAKVLLWVLIILVVSLYLYFSVVWVLALVVSVAEESCGIEALGKAGQLVKGKRLEGFVLNFMLNISVYFLFHVMSKVIVDEKTEWARMISRFVLMSCICLVLMFEVLVYTVLYFKCKKNHGEEIELHGNIEYTEIPQDLP